MTDREVGESDSSSPSASSDDVGRLADILEITSVRCKHGLEEAVMCRWNGARGGRRGGDRAVPEFLRLSTLLEPDDMAPLFSGAEWAGTRVWDAAVRAVEYFHRNHSEEVAGGATVLELGCGLGLPGMVAHLMGGRVVLTDQPSILSQLSRNVKDNFPPDEHGGSIEAKALSWSREGVVALLDECTLAHRGFDFVINCDCVYEPLYGKSWKFLVETIDELLRVNSDCVVLSSCERRNADGVDGFIETMRESENVHEVKLVYENENVQLYLTRGITQ